MVRRKLLKRALPLLLSVSMVFGSMPTTALAAEYDESTAIEETVLDESETTDENAESSDDAPESPMEEDLKEAEESKTSEINTAQETETADADDDNKVETEAATQVQTEITTQTETEQAQEVVENNADVQSAALDTELVIDEYRLGSYINSDNLKYDMDKKAVMAKYDDSESDVFGDLKSYIENVNNGIVSIKVDGKAIDASEKIPEGNLSFKWQKKSGEGYADMTGETPSAPNDYKLVISLNAIDEVCQAATAEIDFVITKRQLTINLEDAIYTAPGTKVQDFVADLTKNYTLQKESRDWYEDSEPDILPETAKGVYIASITAEVHEVNGAADSALAGDSVLMKNCDYTVTVKAALTESMQSSFELVDNGAVNIKIDGLIETKVKAEQKDAAAIISKVYDGTAVSYETDVKDKVTVSIVVPDKDEDESKDTVIEGAQPTLVWCDADKNELKASSEEENADAAPVDAGTYYLDFRFIPTEENENVYKESKGNYIKVVIEPAPLTLKPAALEEGKYFTGMTENDVLKDVDYTLSDAAGADFAFEKETFWGVSYDQPHNAQQAYKPVFKLIRAVKETDGSAKKDKDGNEIWNDNATKTLDASKYLYRLVFTGKKAVYRADGSVIDIWDVNGGEVNTADKNHCIVTTAKTLSENYVNVPMADGKATKIDASAILAVEGVKAAEDFNDLYKPAHFASKVYDGNGLYENRAAYKLAKVTDAEGNPVASDYEDTITYSWFRINSKTALYDEETGKQIGWEEKESSALLENTIPYAAGDYKLVIRFSDVENGYAPSSKTLYYRIDKQLLVVSPTSIPTAYKGEYISDYINERVDYEEEHNIYIVPNNEYSEAIKTEANLVTDWEQLPEKYWDDYQGTFYDLKWYVERLERNDDKTPKKDEDGNNIYTRLSDYDSFKLLDENYYRLGVELVCNKSGHTNYIVVYNADVEKGNFESKPKYYNDYANITVKEMGSVALTIEVDETKLASVAKVYDAMPFYATREEAENDILKALTIRKKATGEALSESDPAPQIYAELRDNEAGKYAEAYEYVALDKMINAGTYTLHISIQSDENYIGCDADENIEYTIKPVELQAKAHVRDDIVAGTRVYGTGIGNDGVIYDSSLTEFTEYEKIPEADKAAFTYGQFVKPYINEYGDITDVVFEGFSAYFNSKIPAKEWITRTIRKSGQSKSYTGYIRYNTDYTVQLDGELAYPYSRNYKVTYEKTPFKAAFRGSSAVYDTSNDTIPTQWNQAELSTTITPMKGIPYVSGYMVTNSRGEEIELEGNYFEFVIRAPEEFKENIENYGKYFEKFVYQNSIEKDAKGYVTGRNSYDGEIHVIIPIDKTDEEKIKSFKVVWENGYTEQFNIDFTNVVLLDDLTKAVAPKSLAFNGVNAKMAVGEEQQLDVKIKKVQISDIIYLDYRVKDNKDVLSITNDDDKKTAGYVTALQVGTATVEAMPVRLVNGKKQDIPGAKPATVKITVSDVTAPAIKGLTAIDESANLTYVKPSDGYRREIYVLEGGKVAEQTFKDKIASMKNGKWNGIFAVEPQYCAEEKIDNAKSKLATAKITGLKADTEYTVYIRNVSGIRTLQDGSSVVASAKGVLKGFKTTKSQVKNLKAFFEKRIEVEGAEEAVVKQVDYKEIALSQKTEQLYVSGKFLDKPENKPADEEDAVWYTLPLDTKAHKEYVAPKLTYWLSPDGEEVDAEYIRDVKNYTYVAGRYYRKTSIATIDAKGKITLKGVGTVYAHVYDPATKTEDVAELLIYANANKVTGKGGKLAVGQRVYLSSLLTYYEDKAALLGYSMQDLSIADETLKSINEAGNFSIVPTGDGDYFITALKPKMSCEFTVTDKLVALLQGASDVTLTLQSAPIEAAKNMKISDIADDRFVINFAYSILADNETWYTDNKIRFRIDITDARGNVVDSVTVDDDSFNGDKHISIKDFNADIDDQVSYYDANKKLVSYRLPYESNKIVRLSSYKVSVKPVYGDDLSAKPAVKAFKTTNFPASHLSLATNEFGGVDISVVGIAGSKNNNNEWYSLSDRPYLTSGNTYTLRLYAKDDIARDRVTDTLTWKSLDTKVATVKVNAGTYTASLNAVKAGATVIEVTSKLTKKVIARYAVFVKAAGNAKDDYYGDYEYIGEYLYQFDPFYNSNIEVLTEANPVRVSEEDLEKVTITDKWLDVERSANYKWVKFTAPKFGEYKFNLSGGPINEIISPSGERRSVSIYDSYTKTIFEGQTYYFKVRNAFTMTVEGTKMSDSLTTTNSVEINSPSAKQYIQFRATEDNCYSFYTKDVYADGIASINKWNEKTQSLELMKPDISYGNGTTKKSVGLHTGDVVYLEMKAGTYKLYAEKREAAELSGSAAQNLSIKDDGEQWYMFTAPAAGDYTFKSTSATAVINMDYYENITDVKAYDTNAGDHYGTDEKDFIYTVQLTEKQTVALKVYAAQKTGTGVDVTASISVSAEVPDVLEANGTPKPLAIPENGVKWVSVKLTEAGRYHFSTVTTEEDASYYVTLEYYKNALDEWIYVDSDEIVVSDQYEDADAKTGDTIYVKVSTNKMGTEEAPATAYVNISLTKAAVTTLTAGAASPLTVENGKEYWYTFTAPSYGIYTFRSVVTENTETGTHSLTAYRYVSVETKSKMGRLNTSGYDFNQSYTLEAGDVVVLKVYSDDNISAATTSAQIRVDKLEATAFTLETPASDSLAKGDSKWYSFTALKDATYTFKKDVTAGSATVYMYGALNAVPMGAVNDSREREMKEGQTIYFNAVNDASDAAVFTITASAPVINPLSDAPVSVDDKETKYYEYTAAKKGRYAISYTVTPAEADVTVKYGTGKLENANSVVRNGYTELDYVATGTKIYFKVSTTSETAVSVSLKAEQVVPTELTAGAAVPVPVAPNRSIWYSFTATEAGRYAFVKTDAENNSTDIEYYDEITNTSRMISDPSGNYFKAGETVYMKLSTTADAPQTTSIKAEKITITPIEATTTTVTIKPGETKYYSFTAGETASYQFDAVKTVGSDTVTAETGVEYYYNTDNDRNYYWWGERIDLAKTNIATFVLSLPSYYDAAGETFTLTYKNIDDELVWLDGVDQLKSVTVNKGDETWIAYEVPEDGLFAFSTTNVPARVLPMAEGEDGFEEGFYYTQSGKAADVIKLCVSYAYDTAPGEDGNEVTEPENVSFSVKVSRVAPEKLTIGAPVSANVAKYEQKWVRFEAEESGRYTFNAEKEGLELRYRMYSYGDEGEMYYDDDGTLPLTDVPMKQGDEIALAVYYNEGADASAIFNISVQKTVINNVAGGTIDTELKQGETKWYEYTAEQTGVYSLNQEGSRFTARMYRNLAESKNNTISSGNTVSLMAKEKVYIAITDTSYSDTNTAKLTITLADLPQVLGVGATINVNFAENLSGKWIAFTPDADGFYEFSINNTSDSDFKAVYAMKLMGFNNSGFDTNISHSLSGTKQILFSDKLIAKDDTVYIYIYPSPSSETDGITITATRNENLEARIEKLHTAGVAKKIVEKGKENAVWYAFYAPEEGMYDITFAAPEADAGEDPERYSLSFRLKPAVSSGSGIALNGGSSYVCSIESTYANQLFYFYVEKTSGEIGKELTITVTKTA